jgi:hypothetical protein
VGSITAFARNMPMDQLQAIVKGEDLPEQNRNLFFFSVLARGRLFSGLRIHGHMVLMILIRI